MNNTAVIRALARQQKALQNLQEKLLVQVEAAAAGIDKTDLALQAVVDSLAVQTAELPAKAARVPRAPKAAPVVEVVAKKSRAERLAEQAPAPVKAKVKRPAVVEQPLHKEKKSLGTHANKAKALRSSGIRAI